MDKKENEEDKKKSETLDNIDTPAIDELKVITYKKTKYYHHKDTHHIYELLENTDEDGNNCVGNFYGIYKGKKSGYGFRIVKNTTE